MSNKHPPASFLENYLMSKFKIWLSTFLMLQGEINLEKACWRQSKYLEGVDSVRGFKDAI